MLVSPFPQPKTVDLASLLMRALKGAGEMRTTEVVRLYLPQVRTTVKN